MAKEVHASPKGICLKVNIIVWLEFKLTYSEAVVQYFGPGALEIPFLVWFYGISNIVGYLMPNPVLKCKVNIWFENTFCWYAQLRDQTVLFLTI